MAELIKPEENRLDEMTFIDKASSTLPWSRELFYKDLKNPAAHYLLAVESGKVLGFAGFWLLQDEMNIVNIAVLPEERRKGYGAELLEGIIALGASLGATFATLEVRAGNIPAQELYGKFGFQVIAMRKKYYADNGEDAVVMIKNQLKQ